MAQSVVQRCGKLVVFAEQQGVLNGAIWLQCWLLMQKALRTSWRAL